MQTLVVHFHLSLSSHPINPPTLSTHPPYPLPPPPPVTGNGRWDQRSLYVFRKLFFWREREAIERDESPAYICPSSLLLGSVSRHPIIISPPLSPSIGSLMYPCKCPLTIHYPYHPTLSIRPRNPHNRRGRISA